MPLVDLKTNLKSLKYGNDRLGNGSSREPFITEPIPEGDTPGASTDFILRQGATKKDALFSSLTTCSYLIRPPPGNKPPSTTPDIGEAGLIPNKFK